jgi:hypothetical protein
MLFSACSASIKKQNTFNKGFAGIDFAYTFAGVSKPVEICTGTNNKHTT